VDHERVQLFIDGSLCDAVTGSTFPLFNPATGQQVATVAHADAGDVDRAVAAARCAMDGPWAKMPVRERMALLKAVADRVDARSDEFLAAEVRDTGKPVSFASKVDIPRGAANFRIFAEIFAGLADETFHSDTPDGLGALNYTQRVPLGVVGVICPWNLPLLLMTWKVAPALAAGNAVVVKPSEETPTTATLLGEVFAEVGVPDGVYNVVHGFGPGSAGEAIVRHPGVQAVTFTGESATGQAIMAAASEDLKRVSFELGGKNPALVFADADLDEAIAGTARSAFSNCGQICLCTERVYVERPIFEPFVAGLKQAAEALQIGDPEDPTTEMGPLISAQHRRKVLSYYELARTEGAEVVTGGGTPQLAAPFSDGCYVQPTILTGLDAAARCVREEIFGPVCHVTPFDDEQEAIALANDTEYGLCAAIWTSDVRRAHRVSARIDAGMVWVNTWFLRDLRTPFGGLKRSGIGREGGAYSIEFYTELKNICVKL
jgi:aminomuconate-semialdehyde/2-hydroxymuconate-6-semialdehyde dehydrogenase